MAQAFIVETGAGLSSASSYVSLAEADDILSTNIHAYPAWQALDEEFQMALLMWATSHLDTATDWHGEKTVATSALRMPRTGLLDRDGYAIDANTIPRPVKQAVCEIARWNIDADRSVAGSQDGLKSLKVDVIEIEFDATFRQAKFPSAVSRLLKGLGLVAGSGGRASTTRIIRV